MLTDRSLSETEKEEFLAIIQKKIDNLTMMVDLFYELSQIDSADKQLIMEQQFLDQLVVEAMLMFYDDFEKSQLRIHVDEVVLPPIIADKKATNRIVTNIIQNALRYAKSYLTITLIEDEKYVDCGLTIYREGQPVLAGGSGSACSAVVTYGHFLKQLIQGDLNRILVVATGSLHSPLSVQQSDPIPCIAHAVSIERSEIL